MSPNVLFWGKALLVLGIETAMVVTVASILTRSLHGPDLRRTVWRATAVALFLLLVCELTGLHHAVATFSGSKHAPPPVRKIIVQTFPALISSGPAQTRANVSKIRESSSANDPVSNPLHWLPALVWFSGFAFVFGRFMLSRIVLLLSGRARQPVLDDSLARRVERLGGRLGIGRTVRISEAVALTGPVAFGVFRPSICLPINFRKRFSCAQQDAMLAHELAHLAAYDPLWYWIADVAVALWWWHPGAYWLRRELQAASETAADDASLLVDEGPNALAESLLVIGRSLAGRKTPGWLGVEGNGFRSGLGRRVTRLLGLDPRPPVCPGRERWLARLVTPLVLLLVLAAASRWSSGSQSERTFGSALRQSIAGEAWAAFLERAPLPAKPHAPFLLADAARNDSLKPSTRSVDLPTELPGDTSPKFYTRRFKVDDNTFVAGLRSLATTPFGPNQSSRKSGTKTNDLSTGTEKILEFKEIVKAAGVDVEPPFSMLYNDRNGMLMVRARLADLDLVEQTIQLLNDSPPQLTIDAKFIEVSEEGTSAADLLKLLGMTNAFARPTAPETILHRATPGTTRGAMKNEINDLLRPDRLPKEDEASLCSILKPSQFAEVVKLLAERKGADILSSPKVTTLSGRQAQIKVVDTRYVVTDFDVLADGRTQPITEPFEFGPVLDVVPWVAADGFTIQMTVIPFIREFLGYDLEAARKFQTGTLAKTTIPLPIFRVRQGVASAVVWDGQTVVVSCGSVDVERAPNGEPLPEKKRKSLFVFVTPTIIDPAGNRVHTPDEMPFRDNSVPPQQPVK